MTPARKPARWLIWIAVIIFQLVLTQAVTFLASFFLPLGEDFPGGQPALFVTILTVTFGLGAFLGGWLAILFEWLPLQPASLARLFGALVGALLPLLAGYFVPAGLQPDSIFFLLSVWGAIAGFYIGGRFRSPA